MHPSRRALVSLALAAVLVAAAAWFLMFRPIPPAPVATGPAPVITLPATLGTTTTERPFPDLSCRSGQPKRLVIPSLRVSAPFEKIGLDPTGEPDASGRKPLGNPKDRTKAGWYADGPRPGDGRGTVLTNGHTYRNNSAIFKEDFSSRIDTGQLIHVEQDNGSTCSYRIDRVWRDVNAAADYPRIVTSEHLYDFQGPERLFLTTCSGSWNSVSQDYDEITLLIATPVNRG